MTNDINFANPTLMVLDLYNKILSTNCQNIGEAMTDFERRTPQERDTICGKFADNSRLIFDIEHARWFMIARNKLVFQG